MRPVLAALLPGYRGDPLPHFMPRHVRLALWLSAWLVTPASLWWWRRPFGWLDDERREDVLQRMSKHPLAPLRGVVQWWKLVAWMTRC